MVASTPSTVLALPIVPAAETAATSPSFSRGALVAQGPEPRGHLLVGLGKDLLELVRDAVVLLTEERRGKTLLTGPTRTTDPVHVVVDVGRQVIVDDVRDMGDIESTGGHVRGDKEWSSGGLEGPKGRLTLLLGTVSVD